MATVDRDIVRQLRDTARQGASVPDILRKLISLLPQGNVHKVTLIEYMRRTFCLTLEQASPIPGWTPERTGELNDARLNELIMPDIQRNRASWDRELAAPTT